MRWTGFLTGISFTQLDDETLLWWQRFQMTVAPLFIAVVALLSAVVLVRNLLTGTTANAGLLVILALMSVMAISGWLFKRYFLRLLAIQALFIMPAMVYQYFSWPAGELSPALMFFPLGVMFQAAANDFRIAVVYLLTGLALVLHNSSTLVLSNWNNISYVVAVGLSICVMFAGAFIMRYQLVNLFKARTGVMESIRQSIEVRRSLLKIFYDEISSPLDTLIKEVGAQEVDWPAVSALNQTLLQAIGKARAITLEVGRKLDFSQQNLDQEIDQIRHHNWKALVHTAAGIMAFLLVLFLLGPWPIRVPLVAGLAIMIVLSRAAAHGTDSLLLRRLSIYVLTAVIAWASFQRLEAGDGLYTILYFTVVVFGAVIICGFVDALVVASVAGMVILGWYLAVPVLPMIDTVIRSNMIVLLVFATCFSVIMGYCLARIMAEIGIKEQKLRIETDMRQRLMATLFHDVANPLHVIISRVELAKMGKRNSDNAFVVKDLAHKIRLLLDVTRELEALNPEETNLRLDDVSLKEVFSDLREIFSERLAAKDMTLQIEPTEQTVQAHRAVLAMSVFANLLNNALKFSPRGGNIRIATCAGTADEAGSVCVSITDEGAGIPAATIARMNRNEPVASTPGTEGESGHGQGLRLASLYLAKMRGRLELEAGNAVKVHLRKSGHG